MVIQKVKKAVNTAKKTVNAVKATANYVKASKKSADMPISATYKKQRDRAMIEERKSYNQMKWAIKRLKKK